MTRADLISLAEKGEVETLLAYHKSKEKFFTEVLATIKYNFSYEVSEKNIDAIADIDEIEVFATDVFRGHVKAHLAYHQRMVQYFEKN